MIAKAIDYRLFINGELIPREVSFMVADYGVELTFFYDEDENYRRVMEKFSIKKPMHFEVVDKVGNPVYSGHHSAYCIESYFDIDEPVVFRLSLGQVSRLSNYDKQMLSRLYAIEKKLDKKNESK